MGFNHDPFGSAVEMTAEEQIGQEIAFYRMRDATGYVVVQGARFLGFIFGDAGNWVAQTTHNGSELHGRAIKDLAARMAEVWEFNERATAR